MESASVLPDIEDDVDEPPPEQIPKAKTFDAITGAPIENEEEKKVNLLQRAQSQMAEPPPSLQTLFGRRVKSKDDPESSDDDDSLFQRQRDFASDNVKSEEDASQMKMNASEINDDGVNVELDV